MTEQERGQLQTRYAALLRFERHIRKEDDEGPSRTVCAFKYGDGPCAVCMYKERCETNVREAGQSVWQMRSNSFLAYKALEGDLRALLAIEPAGTEDRDFLRAMLARVLRREAANQAVFSVEDEDRLREAQEIFEDLYYGSGDPGFREEGESCSRMLDRIRFGMK